MSDLPTDIEVGDAYALRTFDVKDGRLASIAQRGSHSGRKASARRSA